ncbi:MAG: efflux RND transporter permease subunit [Fusobacteriaceae bacterium]
MSLSGIAIKRPVTTTMLMISMLFLGIIALLTLRTEMLPNTSPPIIKIDTFWSGAVAEDVESQITKKIEDILPNVEGIKKIKSTSSFENSTIIIEFDFGVDADRKKGEVQTEVDSVRGDLPDTIDEPKIKKLLYGSGVLTLQAIISADNFNEATSFVENYVKPRLERIKGVGNIDAFGFSDKQIQIQFDSDKLKAYDLTPVELYELIKQSSLNTPIGVINTGKQEVLVRFMGELTEIEDFKNLILKSGGKNLRLGDVAEVILTFDDPKAIIKQDGVNAIYIGVNKSISGNTVEINKEVKKQFDLLMAYAPSNTKINLIMDSSVDIKSAISGVKNSALTGLVFATIILWAFLKNLRTTSLITISLPISIMFTFVFLYFQGMTLNLISLMGLSIGVGMLTDNSVVVIDNIYRHITELKKDVMTAAEDGSAEIGLSLVASALTTMIVFVPILFIPGLAREIFRDMSYSIIYSNLAALIVSLTLMPMIASRYLKSDINIEKSGKVFNQIKKSYLFLRNLAFRNKKKTLLGILIAFIATLTIGTKIVKVEFMPKQDFGKYALIVEIPKGASLDKSLEIMEKMENIITNNKHTKIYTEIIDKSKVIFNVDIGPKDRRKISVFDVQEQIREKVEGIPDIKPSVVNQFQSDSSGKSIEFSITGDNLDEVKDISKKIQDIVSRNKGIVDLNSSDESGSLELRIQIDRDKLQTYGISPSQLSRELSYSFLGGDKTKGQTVTFKTGIEEIDVLVRLPEKDRRDVKKLEQLNIKTSTGDFIKVSDVCKLSIVEATSEIKKIDKIYSVTLSANDGGIGMGEVQEVFLKAFKELNLPKNIGYSWGGESEFLQEVSSQLMMSLAISIFLVYAVLASQFESFALPFIIVGSIPLALIGVYFGLIVTNSPFDVMVMTGIVMLAGTVVNNAIILIDYIEILRKRGMSREKAILRGCFTRLRPIIMTTSTTVLGMLPLAFGIGEGSEIYSGMAIAIIFGMTFSTMLTLIIIPILYEYIEDFSDKILSSVISFKKI